MTLIKQIEEKKQELIIKEKNEKEFYDKAFNELHDTFFHFNGKEGVSVEYGPGEGCGVLRASRNNSFLQLRCYHKSHYFTFASPNIGEMAYQLDRVGHLYDLVAMAFAQLLIGESSCEQEISKPESLPSRLG